MDPSSSPVPHMCIPRRTHPLNRAILSPSCQVDLTCPVFPRSLVAIAVIHTQRDTAADLVNIRLFCEMCAVPAAFAVSITVNRVRRDTDTARINRRLDVVVHAVLVCWPTVANPNDPSPTVPKRYRLPTLRRTLPPSA